MGGQARPELPLGLRGNYYEDTIPDTLELVDHAQLALQHFDATTDEKIDYEMYFGVDPVDGYALHHAVLGCCQPKAMEALAFLEVMTGSTLYLERQAKMVDMMVSLLGEDGLFWGPGGRPDKPWLRISEPFAYIHGQGRMLRAMIAWQQYTGDAAWKGRIDRLVDGLDRLMVVHKDDHAYFPIHGYHEGDYFQSCYVRRGYKDTAEPADEKAGEEGSLFNHQGHLPGALANWYGLTGNEQALRLAGELVRFLTKPKFWADWPGGEYPLVVGAEHAHWRGHFHGHVNALRAILEYAIASNDARLKAFVRDGYEWARQSGFARIGYVGDGQGCGCARLIGLAVKLSDAGVGDYWEDVDQYIRNHGIELQVVPEEVAVLRSLPPEPRPLRRRAIPDVVSDPLLERAVGGFGLQPSKRVVFICCSTHGAMGLYYAWDGIVRQQDGTVRVNLLLNRASRWVDVYSYLPYEGRVVLKNKSLREVFVRIPLWVDRKAVRCTVGQQELPAVWFGNYLRFENLTPGDALTIEFPVVETTEQWTVPDLTKWAKEETTSRVHTCRFRGNTLVSISPPLVPDPSVQPGLPLYSRRGTLDGDQAPTRKVQRYVSPVVFRW
ncbi:MAG: hypothetical protein NT169_14680 [Chloroflexi bacterium]|nr:hypothetical protein [Chloroflexota bacterium]